MEENSTLSDMGNRIKKRRLALGMSQESLAFSVGYKSRASINKIELGKTDIGQSVIAKIANALGVEPGYLLGVDESEKTSLPPGCFPIRMNKVPLVRTIACGTPILAAENIEDHIDMPDDIHADFALRCKGNSMMGVKVQIHDGDVVYIRKQNDVDNGTVAAVLIGDEATLKRVYKQKDKLILQPENPDYSPMVYAGQELEEIRIIGKAVAFMSRID